MRMPPLPADSIHARACKLKCEKILTRPIKLPCAKVLAFGQNVCTAQKRRQPEGRLGALSEPFAGSENIQIGVQFHKNRSFRLKRAALFLGEKEPPAILVGFPRML